MEIVIKQIDDLIPYINNPRKNDGAAVDKVVSSIKNYGFKVPIIVDGKNEIVAGHTRYKACQKLGITEVPCIVADDLTPAQIKAFRIADNRVSAEAEWDFELLGLELSDIGEGFTGFDLKEISDIMGDGGGGENPYSDKVDPVQYEPKGDNPAVSVLVEREKYDRLVDEIEASGVNEDEKDFLRLAASRHLRFSYKDIAEFYCHASDELQELMERSALVLIDYEDAIKNGYVEISEGLEKLFDGDDGNE